MILTPQTGRHGEGFIHSQGRSLASWRVVALKVLMIKEGRGRGRGFGGRGRRVALAVLEYIYA
jgi:hypothetical protein